MNKDLLIDLSLIFLSSLAGILGILLPYLINNGSDPSHYSLETIFPLFRTAWEGFNPFPSILIMIAVGFGLGIIRPHRWLILGLASVFLLIGLANIEMHLYPTSHNLWPLEFSLYFLFIATPTLLGSFVGSRVKKADTRV